MVRSGRRSPTPRPSTLATLASTMASPAVLRLRSAPAMTGGWPGLAGSTAIRETSKRPPPSLGTEASAKATGPTPPGRPRCGGAGRGRRRPAGWPGWKPGGLVVGDQVGVEVLDVLAEAAQEPLAQAGHENGEGGDEGDDQAEEDVAAEHPGDLAEGEVDRCGTSPPWGTGRRIAWRGACGKEIRSQPDAAHGGFP